MGWFIFILWGIIISCLVAVMIAHDEWFFVHERVEYALFCVIFVLLSPFILTGVCFYRLFNAIKM